MLKPSVTLKIENQGVRALLNTEGLRESNTISKCQPRVSGERGCCAAGTPFKTCNYYNN